MRPSSNLPALIERYFTVRLMNERNASANTIACYRDSFRQLFTFAQKKLRTQPSALALDDLDAPFVSAFLADLETKRGVSVRTRNLRLITKEIPRLCRGGSRSLTVPAVAPQSPSTTLRRQATKHIDVPP